MIPQAYDERVTIDAWRPMSVPRARRLRWLCMAPAALRRWRLSEGMRVPVDIMREESGNEPVAAFAMSHPAVPALYMVLTLGLTMFSMQPVLIALSLAGGLAYGFATRGAARTLGALRWQLPVILIIALVNPLFSASGSTELFRIGMRAVYLESMVYGLCMGGLFVASVLWFEAAASMLEYDKVLALLGNAAPVIALMISMCMRLIPQFLRRGRTVLAVAVLCHPSEALLAPQVSDKVSLLTVDIRDKSVIVPDFGDVLSIDFLPLDSQLCSQF